MASAPHLDFAGEVRAATRLPDIPCRAHPGRGHGTPCHRRRQARHGRHDPRAHGRSAYRPQDHREAARTTSVPASARPTASTASTRAATALCIHNAATGREDDHAARRSPTAASPRRRSWWSAPARPASRPRASRRARARGDGVRGRGRSRRPDPADRAEPAPARDDRHHRLAHGAMRAARRGVPLQHLRRGRRRDGARTPTS